MEMDKLGVVTSFIHNIIVYNIPLLYGTTWEIMVVKSGSLNLGVEGIMAVGAIFGYIVGCYANSLLVGALLIFRPSPVTLLSFGGQISLTLHLDGLSFVFAAILAILWPITNLYAFEYMSHLEGENRFFAFFTMTYGVVLGIAFALVMVLFRGPLTGFFKLEAGVARNAERYLAIVGVAVLASSYVWGISQARDWLSVDSNRRGNPLTVMGRAMDAISDDMSKSPSNFLRDVVSTGTVVALAPLSALLLIL